MSQGDPPARPRPSWNTGRRARPRRAAAAPRWQRGAAPAPRVGARRKGPFAVVALGLAAALAGGALVWVALWLQPLRPAAVFLAGAGYQDDLTVPHNAYGLRGLTSLARAVTEAARKVDPSRNDPPLALVKREATAPASLKTLLDEVSAARASTTLLFLAFHGAADDRGPFLLLPRDGGDRAPDRLYVADLVEGLAAFRSQRFVVVLDATQAPALPYQGVLRNDFAAGLRRLAPAVDRARNVVVLASSDVGQQSWVSERWKTTVFAHFLAEGLTAPDVKPGDRLDVETLWRGVRGRVERWARDNRKTDQSPLLLPDPDADTDRSRNRAADFELAVAPPPAGPNGKTEPAPPAGPSAADQKNWEGAWAEHDALASASPAPAVVTPHHWRLYRDWLIRYDELVRAGDDRAGAVKTELDKAAGQVRAGLVVKLPSSAYSLALAHATGAATAPDAGPAFTRLWAATAAAPEPGSLPVLDEATARAYGGLLVRQAAREPGEATFRTALRLLPAVAPADGPRPAEVHYLAMLARDFPRVTDGADRHARLMSDALNLRLRAGRAALGAFDDGAAYPEWVASWLADASARGDEARRLGEDLVFAADKESWDLADACLKAAKDAYAEAEARAKDVRGAVTVWAQALSDLPYYAEWAASLPPDGRGDDHTGAVATALRHAHVLGDALDPGAGGPKTAEAVTALAGKATELRADLDRLRKLFQAAHEGDGRGAVQDGAALRTPFLAAARRSELARRLTTEVTPPAGSGASPSPRKGLVSGSQTAAAIAARRLGTLALEQIGEDWFNRVVTVPGVAEAPKAPGDDLLSYEDVKTLLNGDESAGGTASLARAGRQIEGRRRLMERAVAAWLAALPLPEPGKPSENLWLADRIARRLPAVGDLSADPVEADRRKRLQDVLLAEANRAVADHWYDEANTPYYRRAARAFVDDLKFLDGDRTRSPGIDEGVVAGLRAPETDLLEVRAGRSKVEVTSEPELTLDYRLTRPSGSSVPDGFPFVQVEPGPDDLFRPEGTVGRQRMEVRSPAAAGSADRPAARDSLTARFELPLTARVESRPQDFPRPTVQASSVRVAGLFRGQRLVAETRVEFHPVPDQVALRFPLPNRARLAVEADKALVRQYGEGNGGLAIVLDGSGSMAAVTARGPNGEPVTKYQEATAALRELLGRVGKGTKVSLWVLGLRKGDAEAASDEATVGRVLDPTVWDPSNTAEIDRVMALVEAPAARPWYRSPIVRAMLRARNDLTDVSGFKSLLVLTDGMDNRFAQDAEDNPSKKDIPAALREGFALSDIEVNVIGYKLPDAEEVEARTQFAVIEQLPRPGRFFTVRDSDRLAATLSLALRPSLQCSVETEANVGVAGLRVGAAGGPPLWSDPGLTPGVYKLVSQAGGRREREAVLERGDLLPVRLVDRNGQVLFQRELYSGPTRVDPRDDPRTGWRLSVVGNGLAHGAAGADPALTVWLALEKHPDDRETALQVIKPRETWVELSPAAGGAAAFTQRVASRTGLPAASWSVQVPAWPKVAPRPDAPVAEPSLSVWWDPDQEAAYATATIRTADFDAPEGARARPYQVEGTTVHVESVRFEDARRVEVAPGVFEARRAMVVRLRYEAGKPFFVRPLGVYPDGAEHRFYAKANRYTGVFWTVTREKAAAALEGLGLVSLADFKQRAERRGYVLKGVRGGPPDPGDRGPELVPFEETGAGNAPPADAEPLGP